MQTQINSEINVSYVVALHIWVMVCTFFIFASLIEFPIAISYAYHIEETANKQSPNVLPQVRAMIEGFGESHEKFFFQFYDQKNRKMSFLTRKIVYIIDMTLIFFYGEIDWKKAPLTRNKLDYVSRILFPTMFACFLVIYFLVFVVPRYTFTVK